MHLRDFIGRPDRFCCSIEVWNDNNKLDSFEFPERYFLTDAINGYFEHLDIDERNNF